MGERAVTFALGEYYHLYNRGTDKRIIFCDASDYKRFTELLFLCNSVGPVNMRDVYRDHRSAFTYTRGEQLVAIGAYCLMPNHFHVLATPLCEGGMTKFMNKLGTAYSMYFNKKYERSGALFQGRFKAQHVDDDVYLKYLYAYIHLNPVKLIQLDWKEKGISNVKHAFSYLATYPHSSFMHYLGVVRKEDVICSVEKFPTYFTDTAQHQNELLDWLGKID